HFEEGFNAGAIRAHGNQSTRKAVNSASVQAVLPFRMEHSYEARQKFAHIYQCVQFPSNYQDSIDMTLMNMLI
ncbi:MAG: hypothetical protein V3V03_06305, partial [Hyphomonadaceae bacterium]